MKNFINKTCPRCNCKVIRKHHLSDEEKKVYENDLDLRKLYEERGLICECTKCGLVFYEKREYKEYHIERVTPVPREEYLKNLGDKVAKLVGGYHAGWKVLMYSVNTDKKRTFYEEDYDVDLAIILHRYKEGKK